MERQPTNIRLRAWLVATALLLFAILLRVGVEPLQSPPRENTLIAPPVPPSKQAAATSQLPSSSVEPRIWSALLQRLSDPDKNIRLAAIRELEELRPAASDAVPVLNSCLQDPDPEVRASAVVQLGSYRMLAADSVPQLKLLAFGDDSDLVRSRAKDALYNIRLYDYSPFSQEATGSPVP